MSIVLAVRLRLEEFDYYNTIMCFDVFGHTDNGPSPDTRVFSQKNYGDVHYPEWIIEIGDTGHLVKAPLLK